MRNRANRKEILWFSASIVLVIICMLLPGTIVGAQAGANKNVIHQTNSGNYYNGKNMAVVMTLYERMKLISGEWDSHWQLVDQQQVQNITDASEDELSNTIKEQKGDVELTGYCYMDYQSVLETAEAGMKTFYEVGIYPENPVSDYSNWYRPTVLLYQFSDSFFDSYTCYVWLVELDFYDGSMQHIMLIDDTSGLILAGGVQGEDYQTGFGWRKQMEQRENLPGEIITYYGQQQSLQKRVLDITEEDCYQPQYEVWNSAYDLEENQINLSQLNGTCKRYLLSANHSLGSYEEAVEEVKNIVDNDKFIYTIQWNNQKCWFTLTPFTVQLQQTSNE